MVWKKYDTFYELVQVLALEVDYIYRKFRFKNDLYADVLV